MTSKTISFTFANLWNAHLLYKDNTISEHICFPKEKHISDETNVKQICYRFGKTYVWKDNYAQLTFPELFFLTFVKHSCYTFGTDLQNISKERQLWFHELSFLTLVEHICYTFGTGLEKLCLVKNVRYTFGTGLEKLCSVKQGCNKPVTHVGHFRCSVGERDKEAIKVAKHLATRLLGRC